MKPIYKFCDWIDQDQIINSKRFSMNPHPATQIYLEMNPSKMNWDYLARNTSDWVGELLWANPNKIDWN